MHNRPILILTVLLLALVVTCTSPSPGDSMTTETAVIRLPGHVLPSLNKATQLTGENLQSSESKPLTITIVLKRDRQQEFEQYLHELYDPHSKNFHHFLTQAQISAQFGPSPGEYGLLLEYLHRNGFRGIQRSNNRLTITAQARRADVERAFKIRIFDYRLRGRDFYANAEPPAVPASVAPHIQVIAGLSNLARPVRPVETFPANRAAYSEDIAEAAGLPAIAPDVKTTLAVCGVSPKSPGPSLASGLIQVLETTFVSLAAKLNLFIDAACIGLGSATGASLLTCNGMARALGPGIWTANPQCAEFYSFGLGGGPNQPQVQTEKADVSSPSVASNPQKIGLLEFDTYNSADVEDWLTFIGGVPPFALPTEVSVNGGVASPGPGESEVLLDIDTVMALDTQPATSYVVYDAPGGTTFETMFNTMINDGDTVISNSWAQCEDQTTQAEASAIDSILQTAAASGISVFNGTGDDGSTCLDGSANVVAVPADSPSATAVGGTTPMPGPGLTFGTEAWWNGVADTPPTGQGGFGVSKYFQAPSYQGGLGMRSVPDMVVDADPTEGIQICQADAGGCPTPLRYGGTSMAAPEWAAYVADLNSLLGSNLGAVNPRFYALAGTNAFHSPTVLGSDSTHVGIGSPDFLQLRLALTGQTPGVPISANSFSVAVGSNPDLTAPADGQTPALAQAFLLDANGFPAKGKTVAMTAASGSAVITPSSPVTDSDGQVTFQVTDLATENLTLTTTDTTDGVTLTQGPPLQFVAPPAAAAGINAFPSSVAADGKTPASIVVTLQDALGRPSPGKQVQLSQGRRQLGYQRTNSTGYRQQRYDHFHCDRRQQRDRDVLGGGRDRWQPAVPDDRNGHFQQCSSARMPVLDHRWSRLCSDSLCNGLCPAVIFVRGHRFHLRRPVRDGFRFIRQLLRIRLRHRQPLQVSARRRRPR
jgi:hypothetical protein